MDISNLQKLPSKVGTIVNSTERFLSLAEGGTKVIQACLGVTDIFQNSTLEWDTLVSGIDKLNACKSGIESITFGDPKQQGQQQGGFLQNIEAKLNTIKNKVLELTEPFFKLINVVPVCTNAAKTLNSKDLKKCAKAIKETHDPGQRPAHPDDEPVPEDQARAPRGAAVLSDGGLL